MTNEHEAPRWQGDVRPGAGANAYLWDGTGSPDPGVRRLEDALASARWKGGLRLEGTGAAGGAARARRVRASGVLALAAVLVLAAVAAWIALRPGRGAGVASPAWPVTALAGVPRVGEAAVRESGEIRPGDWLVTDDSSRASVGVASIGHVTVEPGSRLRLVRTGESEHRVELERGKISAFIAAPPRLFLVDTPSAVAVDLGCIYTLKIEPDGSGQLSVQAGMVELHRRRDDVGIAGVSRVLGDARCRIDRVRGAGTPYLSDASAEFIAALVAIDGAAAPDSVDYVSAVDSAVKTARGRDALSLWHLVARVREDEREKVLDALAGLVPPPSGASRGDLLGLREDAMEAWWVRVKARY